MALGLAVPPPERVPVESLSEDDLVARALEERRGRAKTERMAVRSGNPKILWTDYLVTNRASGKTYRVALRGWSHGESYCSCPDFRKNTLGTCKHILHMQKKVRRRFPAASRNRPYRPKEIAVHLLYGRELQLHVLAAHDRTPAGGTRPPGGRRRGREAAADLHPPGQIGPRQPGGHAFPAAHASRAAYRRFRDTGASRPSKKAGAYFPLKSG